MAKWGYRIYTFEMIEGVDSCLMQELEGHRERLLELLQLVGERTRLGKPQFRLEGEQYEILDDEDAVEYDNTEPTLSVRGVDYNKELHVIHTIVALGERGLHDYATNPQDRNDRLDVENRTAETPLRVDFFLATAQTKGFIVAETLGMKDAVSSLAQWINYCSRKQRYDRLAEIDEDSKHFDSKGGEITKTEARDKVPQRFKIRAERAADPKLLKAIIDDMTAMEAEFVQTDINGKAQKRKLSIKVDAETTREKVVDRFYNKNLTTDAIITQTLEDLEIDPQALQQANLGANQIKVRIRSPQGNKTLVPGKLSDLFNYHFKCDGRPRTLPYYRTTLHKLDMLQAAAQIAFQMPDEVELVDWIDREEASWEKATKIDVQ